MTSEKTTQFRTRLTIIVLFLIFLSPFVGSWFLYNYTDIGKDGGAASNGELIMPPVVLEDTPLYDPHDPMKEEYLFKKWTLVYFGHENCNVECMQNVYRMRQIRLATGKHFQRVQRLVILDSITDPAALKQRLQEYRGQLVLESDKAGQKFLDAFKLEGSDEEPFTGGRIYLVDPLGNLMMSYPAGSDPKWIIQDLTKIFRVSRI